MRRNAHGSSLARSRDYKARMSKLLFLFLFCLATGMKCEQYWYTCSKERRNCACAHKYLLASNPGVDVYDRVCVDPATGERLWDELHVPQRRQSHRNYSK